ncbi:hypothetical protein HK405_000676, partial [Cladochytrium tenue]
VRQASSPITTTDAAAPVPAVMAAQTGAGSQGPRSLAYSRPTGLLLDGMGAVIQAPSNDGAGPVMVALPVHAAMTPQLVAEISRAEFDFESTGLIDEPVPPLYTNLPRLDAINSAAEAASRVAAQ